MTPPSAGLMAPTHALSAGDRTPNFVLPDSTGAFRMFYERVQGRPAVLLFAEDVAAPLTDAVKALAGAGVDVFCIVRETSGAGVDAELWVDPARKISEALLAQTGLGGLAALQDGAVAALLLDENQRLLATAAGAGADLAHRVRNAAAAHPERGAAELRRQTAPVLTIPRLLDAEMCAALIRLFLAGDAGEGTVASVVGDAEVSRVHHVRKKRLDMSIADRETNLILQNTIGRRIAPELEKAFNFSGFKFDRFLLCSYDAARADRFRLHRDNLAPSTKDRRFAITLNLNGDSYEGGELVFPEYGPDRYKPGDGGAVIFSCSLLHEALPVTKGVRYALLTFLRS